MALRLAFPSLSVHTPGKEAGSERRTVRRMNSPCFCLYVWPSGRAPPPAPALRRRRVGGTSPCFLLTFRVATWKGRKTSESKLNMNR